MVCTSSAPPVEIDGDDEWEIERILGHRLFKG